MGVMIIAAYCLLLGVDGLGLAPKRASGNENAPPGMGVEHVFFRQKATVHTTRSRWIIGLVLDLKTYERYLLFTNRTIAEAVAKANRAMPYFRALSEDAGVRNQVLFRNKKHFSETWGNIEQTLYMYYVILKQQVKELYLIQGIHDKNWRDFQELRMVGYSELEANRMRTPTPGRSKRVVGAILGGLAGVASVFSIFTTYQLKGEIRQLRENQVVLRSVIKDSLLMVNLTRMEVQENRVKINEVIDTMGSLIHQFEGEVIPMRKFLITNSQMRTNLGKLRDLVSAESDLMNELFQKVDKLATQRLSPTILPAPELVQILKGVELELPPGLMLPQDPRDRPFFYYKVLTTSTVALDDVLLIGIEVPLLDVSRKLKVMETIALPVPYTGTDLTAAYDLEFRNFAISEDGRQYVVLTLEDQMNCAKKDISYCSLTSAIRETNRHSSCTLALYQRDEKKIQSLCQIKVSNRVKLPTAHYVSRGEWLVATGQPFNLRKHCGEEQDAKIVPVRPPYTVVILESGCSAIADVIELPIYFEERREYHVVREDRILEPPSNIEMTELTIWKEMSGHRKDLLSHLTKLGDIEEQPIDELLRRLETVRVNSVPGIFPDSKILYILVGLVICAVVVGVGAICCRRKLKKRALQRTRGRLRSQPVYERELTAPLSMTQLTIEEDADPVHRRRIGPKPQAPLPPRVSIIQEEDED